MERIEVNYKNKKRYNTAVYPRRQMFFLTWLIYFLSKIVLSSILSILKIPPLI